MTITDRQDFISQLCSKDRGCGLFFPTYFKQDKVIWKLNEHTSLHRCFFQALSKLYTLTAFLPQNKDYRLQVCKVIEKKTKKHWTSQTFIYDIQYWEQKGDERKILKRIIVCFGLCQSLCQFRPWRPAALQIQTEKQKTIEMLWHKLAQSGDIRSLGIQSSNLCYFNKKPDFFFFIKPIQQKSHRCCLFFLTTIQLYCRQFSWRWGYANSG